MKHCLTNCTLFVADDCKASHVLKGVEKIVVKIVDIVLKSWSGVGRPKKEFENISKKDQLKG